MAIEAKRVRLGSLDAVSIGSPGAPTVVLCHGFGAPGDDLVPLVQVLPGLGRVRYVFPEAPLGLGPMFGGGRAWWHIDFESRQTQMMSGNGIDLTGEEPEGLSEARTALVSLVDALVAEGTQHRQLVLGGFSQGAMLALDTALRTAHPFAGLLLMSTTYLCRDVWQPLMSGLTSPIFQSHGTRDPILPYRMAESLRDALRAAGREIDFVSFPGEHAIPSEVLEGAQRSIDAWLPG